MMLNAKQYITALPINTPAVPNTTHSKTDISNHPCSTAVSHAWVVRSPPVRQSHYYSLTYGV